MLPAVGEGRTVVFRRFPRSTAYFWPPFPRRTLVESDGLLLVGKHLSEAAFYRPRRRVVAPRA
jgi:hypothetical protein